MSKKEQREWFKQEWEKKNPILQAIIQAAVTCTMSVATKEIEKK